MKESEISRAKERYEKMLAEGSRCYFEPEEIEAVADSYEADMAFRKALQVVSHGLELYPSNEALMLRKSRCLLNLNRIEDALQAIALVTDLCVEYYLIHGEIELVRNDPSKALGYFEQVVTSPDATIEDCIVVLDTCMDYDRMDLLEKFTAFCETRLDDMIPYYRELAIAYEERQEDEKAIILYNKILDSVPYSSDDWFALAKLYARLKRYPEALEACDFALAIDENDESIISFKGYCYYDNAQYPQAVEQFIEFARLTSDKAVAYGLIAEAYTRMDKHEEAIEYLQKAVTLNDRSHDLYYQLAVNYYYMGQDSRAIAFLNKAIACDDGDDESHVLLGELLLQQGEYAEAYNHLTHVDLDPLTDVESGTALSDVCIHLKRYEEALGVLQQLFELESYEPHHIFNIILLYINLGNYEKAAEWLVKAEKLSCDIQNQPEIDRDTRNVWKDIRERIDALRSLLRESLNEDL